MLSAVIQVVTIVGFECLKTRASPPVDVLSFWRCRRRCRRSQHARRPPLPPDKPLPLSRHTAHSTSGGPPPDPCRHPPPRRSNTVGPSNSRPPCRRPSHSPRPSAIFNARRRRRRRPFEYPVRHLNTRARVLPVVPSQSDRTRRSRSCRATVVIVATAPCPFQRILARPSHRVRPDAPVSSAVPYHPAAARRPLLHSRERDIE